MWVQDGFFDHLRVVGIQLVNRVVNFFIRCGAGIDW